MRETSHRKGKSRWRSCHRLNTPTRDPEGQGVSPAWNAADACWRTNPLETLAFSLPFSLSLPSLFFYLSVSLLLSLSISLSVSSSAAAASTPLVPPTSTTSLRCHRKHSVQFETTTCFGSVSDLIYLSLSLVFIPFTLLPHLSSFSPFDLRVPLSTPRS